MQPVLMFTYAHTQPNTISQSMAIPGNSLKKVVIRNSYKKPLNGGFPMSPEDGITLGMS